jgi:hypothetical protein
MRAAALVATFGAVLLAGLALIPYGPGMTPDSVHYLSAGENLRQGFGFATSVVPWDGPFPRPLVEWPPLFPLVLAVTTVLGGTVAGPWALNALLLAASTWQTARLSGSAPLLGVLIFLASPAVVGVHGYVWSEPLFLLLVLLSLQAQERLLAEAGPGRLASAAALTGLACLTRYLGVTLAISGALALAGRRRPLQALAFAGLSTAPLGLWLLRNRSVAGSLAGELVASGGELSDLLREAARTLGGWMVPLDASLPKYAALAALLALGAGLLRSPRREDLPWLAFLGVYLAAVIALARAVAFDPLTTRLLVPVVPPLAVLAARHFVLGRNVLAAAGAVLLLGGPALVTARDLAYAAVVTKGRGYRAAKWRETEAVRLAVRGEGPFAGDGPLYSDAADLLYLYSGRPVRYLPEASTPPEELRRAMQDRGSAIVLVRPTLPGLLGREDLLRSSLFGVDRKLGQGAVLLPSGGI